jgi:phosphinothricin acetyltransferase
VHQVTTRTACTDDVPALRELRNYYIANSNATFDEKPLDTVAVSTWIAGFSESGPYRLLVAEFDQRLVGYCSSRGDVPCVVGT